MKPTLVKRLARAMLRLDDTIGMFGPLFAYIIGHLAVMWIWPIEPLLPFIGGIVTYTVYLVLLHVAMTIDWHIDS